MYFIPNQRSKTVNYTREEVVGTKQKKKTTLAGKNFGVKEQRYSQARQSKIIDPYDLGRVIESKKIAVWNFKNK